jgi:hypothetical protein
MKSFRRMCGVTLATLLVAFCCSTVMAQTSDSVEQRLQQLQNMLNQQQKQINQLQKENQELKQAQQKQQQATVSPVSATSTSAQPKLIPAVYDAQAATQAAPAPAKPEGPTVVPAIAPLRVLPIDPPKVGGLVPAFKAGPVAITPYGFIKTTAVYDTSNPNGDDFPFVGLFLTSTTPTNTGPNGSPGFHVKARSTRVGSNFEWPDMSKKLAVTGRIEADFEQNFSEVDNADVTSIRNSAPRIRLAYGRLDYHASDATDVFFKFGQDWSLFGSSVLPPILETTFLGAFYGSIYTRTPQMTVGWVQDLSSSHTVKFMPEFGIMMPSSGQILKLGSLGLAGQLAEGEDEGAFSGRPEIEGRAVLQFQLDHAKGVAPAQILIAGFQGRRESIVAAGSVTPLVPGNAPVSGVEPASYLAAFPGGFTSSSEMYGGQVGVQLPTRFITLTGSLYQGGDLRFYGGGQVNSYATSLSGLTNPIVFTTTDGGPMTAAGTAALACNISVASAALCPKGNVVVAPQKPIRSFGGFVSAGFPFSRWVNADPKGRNAGWTGYLTFGKDQVYSKSLTDPGFATSVNTLSPLPLRMGKMAVATLNYRLNPFVTFAIEQSIYATRLATPSQATLNPGLIFTSYIVGTNPNGTPRFSNEWQDHRTEFGPIFTF